MLVVGPIRNLDAMGHSIRFITIAGSLLITLNVAYLHSVAGANSESPDRIKELIKKHKNMHPEDAYAVCIPLGYCATWLRIGADGQTRYFFDRRMGVWSSGKDRKLHKAELERLGRCFRLLPDDGTRKMVLERIVFASYPTQAGRVVKLCDRWTLPEPLAEIFRLADRHIAPWYPGGDAKPLRQVRNRATAHFRDIAICSSTGFLVSVHGDGKLRYWNPDSGEVLAEAAGEDYAEVSPSGNYAAAKTRRGLSLVGLRTKRPRLIPVRARNDLSALRVGFSHADDLLAVKLHKRLILHELPTLRGRGHRGGDGRLLDLASTGRPRDLHVSGAIDRAIGEDLSVGPLWLVQLGPGPLREDGGLQVEY